MRKPTLFLDFDGVLNSLSWIRGRDRQAVSHFEWKCAQLDPACIELIDDVIERAGCQVVVSSSWRLGNTVRELQVMLRRVGMRNATALVDRTPHEYRDPESGIYTGEQRGGQIQRWLDANGNPGPFAIVDDESDMIHLKPRLVKTDVNVGITRADADRLIELLMEE
jgi:hypothetical protein